MALDATIGGVNANSYPTLAYANSFFEKMLLPNAWDDAVPDDQERALMTATQWLEEYDYVGRAATLTQALKWPRFGIEDELILGLHDETEMPVPLLNATCELAFYLLTLGAAGGATALTTGLGPISSLKIGNSVEVKYQQQSASATATQVATTDSSGLPIHIARLLRGLRLPVVIA
jgi:DnaT-like ssDNA binding protein